MTHTPISSARPEEALDAEPSATLSTSNIEATVDDHGDNPDVYNPEDYRWVPVRRRPRYDGWTEEKQRRFIEALADTGLVNHAAKAVGMTRESAYRLRRSAHGAAFARAWDAAREHAGCALEDIAFERAIEGVEHNVYDQYGEIICTKRVYNDRLLTFLLRHLKPERYAPDATGIAAPTSEFLETSLRAMEPQLPAPPEALMDAEALEDSLDLADLADGFLPHFLAEQRPDSPAQRPEKQQRDAALHRAYIASGLSEQRAPPPRRFR
ncbi:hypothetical protein [Sphingorhabdus sp.]|uniref:hypothetical protein n=1 Tax=Sphingorhabdus sp. TaxID=1902408 RepID=UPI00391D5000